MDDDGKGARPATALLRIFAGIFTMMILSMTFAGALFAGLRDRSDPSAHHGIFGYGFAGLPFASLAQAVGLSLALSLWVLLIMLSPRLSARLRFLTRACLLYVATILSASAFAAIFGWFPSHIPRWSLFVALAAATLCFALAFALAALLNRLEARRYERLLANYKARRRSESSEQEK